MEYVNEWWQYTKCWLAKALKKKEHIYKWTDIMYIPIHKPIF